MKCEHCGNDVPLYLHSRCHADAPVWCVLDGDILSIECAECGKLITRFRVMKDEEK